jgi:hypothetical protein
MSGHFAVLNQWTEINSIFEGAFMERFAPGAFKKTIRENRDSMRVLLEHGHDPSIGNKPLGAIRTLREDGEGAFYEVDLLDAGYVREDILPGLEKGLYGASFRFRVIREEVVEEPKASAQNPKGLPERTVKEAEVMEFGPVTFPAYSGASAGIRSVTDEFRFLGDTRGVVEGLGGREREFADHLRRELALKLASPRSEEPDAADEPDKPVEEPTAEEPGGDEPDEPAENEPEGSGADAEPSKPEGAEDGTEPDGSGADAPGDTAGTEKEDDAPPVVSAGTESHPDRGRRDDGRLYGDSTLPSWRLT